MEYIANDSSSDDEGPPILERQEPYPSVTHKEHEIGVVPRGDDTLGANANDAEIYEVEKILKSRKTSKGLEYLVKWVGWSVQESTWEPKCNLSGAAQSIKLFEEERFKQRGRDGRRENCQHKSEQLGETTMEITPVLPPAPPQSKKPETKQLNKCKFEPLLSEHETVDISTPIKTDVAVDAALDEPADISSVTASTASPDKLPAQTTSQSPVSVPFPAVTLEPDPVPTVTPDPDSVPETCVVTEYLMNHQDLNSEIQTPVNENKSNEDLSPQCSTSISTQSNCPGMSSSATAKSMYVMPTQRSFPIRGIPTSRGPSVEPIQPSLISPTHISTPQTTVMSPPKIYIRKILFVKVSPNPDDRFLYLAEFSDSTRSWINSTRAAVQAPFPLIEYLQSLIHFQISSNPFSHM